MEHADFLVRRLALLDGRRLFLAKVGISLQGPAERQTQYETTSIGTLMLHE